MLPCAICREPIPKPLYRSASDVSVTSLCEILPVGTEVWYCDACTHLQTRELGELEEYYDSAYQILIDSEEEDQLYALVDGKKVFRTAHQVATLLAKVSLPEKARVLDYGCAKSATLRALTECRPDVVPYVFDVSEMYQDFWSKFLPAANCATHTLPAAWVGTFDLVTSFFALEHVAEPIGFASKIAAVLKPGGHFYGIVPNVYANTADFVVADHVSHFSAASLTRLLTAAGFEIVSLDAEAHKSAWVVVARKTGQHAPVHPAPEARAELRAAVENIASYWHGFAEQVCRFENETAADQPAAIYGAGFYGTFIASCLRDLSRVVCFLDQNPFRQKHQLRGLPILPPEALPENVRIVYAGLNPVHAREIIGGLPSWRQRPLNFFFP